MKPFIAFAIALIVIGCTSSVKTNTVSANSEPATSHATEPATSATPAATGSISGVINFQGAVPKLPSLDMTGDPMCPQTPQPSEAVVVNNGKLTNVFVYVKEGLPAGQMTPPSEPAVVDQKQCRYVPRVLGVMVGQPFEVTTHDQAIHNVHPMPSKNTQWNETQMPDDKPIVKKFTAPEMMVRLQCNQHPWMRAYVNVMTNPYFAVSKPDGSFEIKNLPPGEYTLAAVHEKFGEKTMKVKVSAQQPAKANFDFSAGK
ncbi:MAG TPA: DUF2012 domain-containing protein [Candidatus Angelobacter sp.]|jgi:plastocyanin|nr:DUF2012 domain-containing protein [Candidatus Angelobacter sp.]